MANTNDNYCLPNLIIGGVHKAATTSLHTYLSLHPDVCGSLIKELAFLLPARYNEPVPNKEEYAKHFSHCKNQKYILETTPSYLYGGTSLINAIKETLGSNVKVIMILRNPVDRFISFYRHNITKMIIPSETTLFEFINQSVKISEGVRSNSSVDITQEGLVEGVYANYLPEWINAFGDKLLVVFFDDLVADTPHTVKRICKWLGINPNVYKKNDFEIENRTVDYKLGVLHKFALWVNYHTETFWRSNIKIKRFVRSIYNSLNEKKSNTENKNLKAEQELHDIYKQPNKDLLAILKKHHIKNLPSWVLEA